METSGRRRSLGCIKYFEREKLMRKCSSQVLMLILLFTFIGVHAQDKLYPNEFPLNDVVLLDGPFKYARDLNIQTLLKYDVDRLLAPFLKEAGLPEKAKLYPNWAGLDGHIGGHYLSAMAINYAATGNTKCKKRLDYMVSELKICQDVNGKNFPDWGKGYIGGAPNSKSIWSTFQKGDFTSYQSAWAIWYNLHKIYAGLRDAWLYAGNEDAGTIFLNFCDWGINITSELSNKQMQLMLDTEHGGMNEIFADAYQMTGNAKYLEAAKRFSHRILLDSMAADKDNLDNKHANTQIPKVIGFQRIAELTDDPYYGEAASFFWNTVAGTRSLAFGGNSRREFFPGVTSCTDFIYDVEGPETCNSYNMLKLTEGLFRQNPSAKYTDYYERTMINHILSSQHPEHGGYVYFTPARPRHYRVYSAPNEAMWCCVGTGMENHSKYNQFIYTHQNNSLYLNLFVNSELNWREKGLKIKQETNFPFEEQTKLKITEGAAQLELMIRYPSWVADGALKIIVNGKPLHYESRPSSYIAINRFWRAGDEILILLPMQNTIEHMPNVPNYIALLHGPVLLGAKTGTENLKGLVADDSRWGQIAGGERLPVDKAPIIVEDDLSAIATKLVTLENKPLSFNAPDLKMINPAELTFEPFFMIHDSRYMIYWMALSNKQYRSYLDSLSILEIEKLELQKRTIDFVAPGEQQPEKDHDMQSLKSNTGNFLNEFWRDARNEGYFSYNMTTNTEKNLCLIVRYWGAEWGSRKFDIYLDEQKLISEDITGKWNQSRFLEIEYVIPDQMVKGKDSVRVKFEALPENTAGAVYYIRLVKKKITPL
jgi:DUF1680 family protein